jgi:uncharacterized UPF0146 family protein
LGTSLAELLWTSRGERRVPSAPAFDRAASASRKGALEKLCEFNPWSPIYLIPTRPFLRALAKLLRGQRVVEVAAGDGFLSRELRKLGVDIVATDSGKWSRPEARMNARERRTLRNVRGLALGPDVLKLDALEAIRKLRPELVLCSWLPPGPLLLRLIEAAPKVLEIGAGSGITGDIRAWKFEHDFLEDLEKKARCRLDERPREALHTRVTLYRS